MSSLYHQGVKKGVGLDKEMSWASALFIYLTNMSTPVSMSLQFLKCLRNRSSSLEIRDSATLFAYLHRALGTFGGIGEENEKELSIE